MTDSRFLRHPTSKPRADASIVVVLRSTMWKWKPKKHKSISASVPSTRSAIHVTRNCVGVHPRRSGERRTAHDPNSKKVGTKVASTHSVESSV